MNTTAPTNTQRTVLVPAGAFDRRALAALHHAAAIPAARMLAVHVAADPAEVERLAQEWMTARIGVPLYVIDSSDSVPVLIGNKVRALLDDGAEEVVVVLGRQTLEHRWQRLLHRGTADAIAAVVDAIPGAVLVVVVVPTCTARRSARNATRV